MITMRQLEALRAVIDGGTTVAAAERMRLSQPAVSKLISNLEHETRLTLFRRDKRRLEPTPEARLLYERALGVFDGLREVARLSADLRDLAGGALSIFSVQALGRSLLPALLSEYLKSHRRTRVSLQVRASRDVVHAIASRQADFGLAMNVVDDPGLARRRLCRANAVCALPPGHPLERRGTVAVEDLAGAPFVSFTQTAHVRGLIDALFDERGVEPEVRIDTATSETACAFVANGAGAALVDPFTAEAFVRRGEIVVRPFAAPAPYDIFLVSPLGAPLSLLAKDFIAILEPRLRRIAGEEVRSADDSDAAR